MGYWVLNTHVSLEISLSELLYLSGSAGAFDPSCSEEQHTRDICDLWREVNVNPQAHPGMGRGSAI